MVTHSQPRGDASFSPIRWAVALVLVIVALGYTYTIVTRCQTSEFEFINALKIRLGKCELPPVPPEPTPRPAPDVASAPVLAPSIRKIVRDDLPCPWVWVFLGRFSKGAGKYELPPSFTFLSDRGPGLPYPRTGESIVLTTQRTPIITGYAAAPEGNKCARMLDPPWGYRPATIKEYEAGKLNANSQVLVNRIILMPSENSDPFYVWALVGPA